MARKEFSARVKAQAAKRANGHCEGCGVRLRAGEYHYDHADADGLGGQPTLDNCRVLCIPCHKVKTKLDTAIMVKADNQRKRIAQNIVGPKAKIAQRPKPIKVRREKMPLPPRQPMFEPAG